MLRYPVKDLIHNLVRESYNDISTGDVTLVFEGGYTKIHKVILCAMSPLLRDILRGNFDVNPKIILDGRTKDEVTSMINLLYCGETVMFQSQNSEFMEFLSELNLVDSITRVTSDNSKDNIGVKNEKTESIDHLEAADIKHYSVKEEAEDKEPVAGLEKKNSCTECGKVFVRMCDLRRHGVMHRKKEVKEETVECGYCAQVLKSKYALSVHVHHKHKQLKEDLKCSRCDFSTKSKVKLGQHSANCIKCKICGYVSSSKEDSAEHTRLEHDGRPEISSRNM